MVEMKIISKAPPGTAGFDSAGILHSSRALVEIVRQQYGNKLILGFSGKDSLAAWLFLREQGFEIIPYMLYTVPGLRIDVEAREYYQEFFGTKIYYLPHPLFYSMLRYFHWQPPHAAALLWRMNLLKYDFAYVENLIAEEQGMGENYLSVVGYLASDNLGRNSFINRSGTIGTVHRKYYFAIWDWTFSEVMEIIHKYGAKLPRHYRIWGNTGTGRPFEYAGLKRLRDMAPDDYARVLKWFPLLEAEFIRYEVVSKWQSK